MITITHEQDFVHVAVLGEFTLSDFREFEENVLYEIRFRGRANLLFDLTEMLSYTIDMAVEEVRFSRAHRQDFGKVALLTNDQWVTWSAWLAQILTDARIELFPDMESAKLWLTADSETDRAPVST
ncbi:STAS/SEC14 domain-containing protein [Chitiniphilus eburneus]|uniref:STAS/SEC14 domain-containing protein n=1 Tax=Chitiniphilus eburneus TaxID=2571148 RepID=A0A4U0PKL3_9NEIS|nr:STAS/SEC14 domain-containing protein [Chitiniphilus eburneus]TJZ67772.1 STAS/SEC14 domain-containing protein [Chitiniphilus eburneus]